jgi:hypothetical protein
VILEKLYDRGGCGSGLILKRYSVGQWLQLRGVSVNSVVKAGYCDNSTTIHEFAKSFLELLEHNKENESRE